VRGLQEKKHAQYNIFGSVDQKLIQEWLSSYSSTSTKQLNETEIESHPSTTDFDLDENNTEPDKDEYEQNDEEFNKEYEDDMHTDQDEMNED